MITQSIVPLEPAGDALLVIHTGVGMAQRAGLAIDRLGWREAAGTVAGDDTLFLAARNRRDQRILLERLRLIWKGEAP
jgi:transcriptional regulator of arginine metabolism